MKEQISCFDIDGTLSKVMLFAPLVENEHANGYLSDNAFAKIHDLFADYQSGELGYEDVVEKLLQTHAKGLRGEKLQDLKVNAENFLVSHEKELFHKFGKSVVQLLGARQKLFVVTAEPQYLAEAVADMYGINEYLSSLYSEQEGVFTGKVDRSLAQRHAKSLALQNYEIEYAFGDSEGDIDMLADARHRYCISPTKGLATVAGERGWNVFNGNDEALITKDIEEKLKR